MRSRMNLLPIVPWLLAASCSAMVAPANDGATATDARTTSDTQPATDAGCMGAGCSIACQTSRDCPAGQICNGPPGCGVAWHCRGDVGCLTVESTWCDCAGNTFRTGNGCAERPYAHAGACEMPPPPVDAGTCGADGSICRDGTQCCSGFCLEQGTVGGRCQRPPPGMFGCGTTLCTIGRDYCELTYSDVPQPDSMRCIAIPVSCGGRATCGCVTHTGCAPCEARDERTIVFRCPGG